MRRYGQTGILGGSQNVKDKKSSVVHESFRKNIPTVGLLQCTPLIPFWNAYILPRPYQQNPFLTENTWNNSGFSNRFQARDYCGNYRRSLGISRKPLGIYWECLIRNLQGTPRIFLRIPRHLQESLQEIIEHLAISGARLRLCRLRSLTQCRPRGWGSGGLHRPDGNSFPADA